MTDAALVLHIERQRARNVTLQLLVGFCEEFMNSFYHSRLRRLWWCDGISVTGIRSILLLTPA